MTYIKELLVNKELWKWILVYYIIFINIVCYIIFGIDKRRAINKEYRIRESTFIILSFMGGSIGILIGMVMFKHKLRKKKFYIGIPLIYILNKIAEFFINNYLLK